MGCISYLLDGLTSDLANLAFAGRLLGQLLSSVTQFTVGSFRRLATCSRNPGDPAMSLWDNRQNRQGCAAIPGEKCRPVFHVAASGPWPQVSRTAPSQISYISNEPRRLRFTLNVVPPPLFGFPYDIRHSVQISVGQSLDSIKDAYLRYRS
jgi:hypothetical protein